MEEESEEYDGNVSVITTDNREYFVNICLRCNCILGTTKLFYTVKAPHIQWFFSIKKGIPLMCDKCFCFMCDECIEIENKICPEPCNGSFIPYRMFKDSES